MLSQPTPALVRVRVRTACCTEAPRAVSGCTLCKVYSTVMLEDLEEGFSCGRVPHGQQGTGEAAVLEGVARLSTAVFFFQDCSVRSRKGRKRRWRSNKKGWCRNKTYFLMCGRRSMDDFRYSGLSVQPVAQQESAVAGVRGQTSLQGVLVQCQSPSPALSALEFLCQVCPAKVWKQPCILHTALQHLPRHNVRGRQIIAKVKPLYP